MRRTKTAIVLLAAAALLAACGDGRSRPALAVARGPWVLVAPEATLRPASPMLAGVPR